MTHITGPRKRIVKRLQAAIANAIVKSGATITESKESIHEVDMELARIMLAPWENETCPTCPDAMRKEGKHIKRRNAA
jgi:hypothetical protein